MIRYILFFCMLICFACQSKKEEQALIATPSNTVIDNSSIPLTYSDNWELINSNVDEIEFFLFSRKNTNRFKENINLMTNQLSPTTDLETFAKETLDYLKKVNEKEIINHTAIEVNGEEAEILEYKADLTGEYLYYYQLFMVKDGKSYVLTFSSDLEDATTLKPEVKQIFASFNIP